MIVSGIFTIIQQQVDARPEEPVSSIASGILRQYTILADTKTGTTSLANKEVIQEMQQAAEEIGEEFILLEHQEEHEYKVTLFSYDTKGRIDQNTPLPDELEPIAEFPNQDSLQETNDVRAALEDWVSSNQGDESGAIIAEICKVSIDNNGDGITDYYYWRSGDSFISADEECIEAPAEESSDQSEEEEDMTNEEEDESRGSDDSPDSNNRDNNDNTVTESGKRGEEDRTDKITNEYSESSLDRPTFGEKFSGR